MVNGSCAIAGLGRTKKNNTRKIKSAFRILKFTPNYCPVPDSEIFCGLPPPLSVIETAAVLAPVAVGVKVTLMVQLAPAATLVPQVLVWAKSLTLVPEIVTPIILRDVVPTLVRVTVCIGEVVATD